MCVVARLRRDQALEIPAAHDAALVLVPAGALPVCFEADVPSISVPVKSFDLAFPIDSGLAHGAPARRVPVHRTVLRVNVSYAVGRQFPIAFRKWRFAGYQAICRVPDQFQVGMLNRRERRRRFRRSRNVAGMLVFQSDDQVFAGSLLRQPTQRFNHAIENPRRVDSPPVGEHTNNPRACSMRNFECPACIRG